MSDLGHDEARGAGGFGSAEGGEFDASALVIALREAGKRVTAGSGLRDTETTLTRLVATATATIPGVSGGGISRTEHGSVSSSHGTDPSITELDQIQADLYEGPCIAAADDPPASGVVLVGDLEGVDAQRWPRFAAAAVEAGYRSMLSISLSTRHPRHTALNLYAHEPDVFDDSAQLSAEIFGLHAAALLHGADQAAHLSYALASRDVIGQAKGILMERFNVDDTAAFELLTASSQQTNLKLVDVARWVTTDRSSRFDNQPTSS